MYEYTHKMDNSDTVVRGDILLRRSPDLKSKHIFQVQYHMIGISTKTLDFFEIEIPVHVINKEK